MIINEKNIDIKEFQRGIQMILEAFNEQKKQYIAIINSMNEKIISLEHQIDILKEDNSVYQNKLHNLQKNIKSISKSIIQLKDDEISINDDDNNEKIDKKDDINLKENKSYWKSLINKNNKKDNFEINFLNKIENQKTKNRNDKNKYINELNYYTRENDISVNKKDKIYKKAINKILSSRINKNKNDSKNMHNKDNNSEINKDFNKYYENNEENKANSKNNKIKNE